MTYMRTTPVFWQPVCEIDLSRRTFPDKKHQFDSGRMIFQYLKPACTVFCFIECFFRGLTFLCKQSRLWVFISPNPRTQFFTLKFSGVKSLCVVKRYVNKRNLIVYMYNIFGSIILKRKFKGIVF